MSTQSHPPCRILIVEDEFLVAMDMELQLLTLGYDVVGTANTGEEAISLADATEPNLVLMDVNLHGKMDGIEAATCILHKQRVPIIFVTAFGNEDVTSRIRAVTTCESLRKPYSPEDLKRVIGAALKPQGANPSNLPS